MFGYVKPVHSELRMREYECYRAYYCGLCHAMGKCTGQCSRLTLSYDMVFLAAVRCYLAGEKPEIQKKRCLPHPLHPRRAVIHSEQLAYCADASALLTYRKLQDDLSDEKGMRRLRARLGKICLSGAYRKAKKRHPELDSRIAAELERLAAYESAPQGQPVGADYPAEIFGALMRSIFSEGLSGSAARIAGEIGKTVGHWIYLVDAADDFEEDRKKGRFNPFVNLLGEHPTEEDWKGIRTALTAILCDTERAFLLMDQPPCPELKEIIANILYLGLPDTAERTVCSEQTKNDSQIKKEKLHE